MSGTKKIYTKLWLVLSALLSLFICIVAFLPSATQASMHAFGQKATRAALGLIIGDELAARFPTSLIILILFCCGTAFLSGFVWLAAYKKFEDRYKALLPALYAGGLVTVVCGLLKWMATGSPASWSTLGYLALGCLLAVFSIAFFWFLWDHFPLLINKETVRYVVFGAMATFVNLISFNLCYYVFGLNNGTALSTSIAWVVAVIFAFFTNKIYVFESKTETKSQLIKEMILFFGARLFTYLVTVVGMYLFVDLTHWFSAGVGKIITCIIEFTLNYVFSKLFIFKKVK